jgi:2-keto-4-pentenoate hydratase/2-oxohepta-3-ene-1,7-dioic acid hydratase in catechol pathway
MKLVTYSKDGKVSWGVVTDKGIVDIRAEWKGGDSPGSIKEILVRGEGCLKKVGELSSRAKSFVSLESVKFLAPIDKPDKIIALAGNYHKHIKEMGRELGMGEYSPR